MEMGYYSASYELAQAHLYLAERYASHGGADLKQKLKLSSRVTEQSPE
jgi:hypothetical protein